MLCMMSKLYFSAKTTPSWAARKHVYIGMGVEVQTVDLGTDLGVAQGTFGTVAEGQHPHPGRTHRSLSSPLVHGFVR